MARVKAPLFSLGASGQVGKAIVYSNWKGREYCREYQIPANPQSAEQMNIRYAMTLLVDGWQALGSTAKTAWNEFAKPYNMSGYNQYVSRGMQAYVDQLGVATAPVSYTLAGNPPADVWTWSAT